MTAYQGTTRLFRLALRRDRVQLPVWIVALTVTQWVTAASVLRLYPTEADRVAYAVGTARSAAAVAFDGIVSGTGNGAVVTSQSLLVVSLGAALMSTLAVIRHSRQEEETGRAEMLGAAVVGRHALLASAVLTAVAANVVLGLANAIVLAAYGLPIAGSIATGAAIAAVGISFAGVAAICAQVTEGARAANGMAAGALGVAFLLRAVGDVSGRVSEGGTYVVSGWLSWLSPVGWGQQVLPFASDRWWVLALPIGLAGVLLAGAYAVVDRRDLGAGLFAARGGPPHASPRLRSALGLAWRLQRGVLIGWLVALVVLGSAYGSIGDQLDDLIGTSGQMADLLEQLGGERGLVDAYFSTIMAFLGIAVAGYSVQALLRLRGEESSGRAEPVLAAAVSRRGWLASHVIVAMLGAVLLMIVSGASAGVAYGAAVGDFGDVGGIIRIAVEQIPAVLVVASAVVVIFALAPRLAVGLSWALLGAILLLAQLGPVLELPSLVLDASPFRHVRGTLGETIGAVPIVALVAVALALAAAGFTTFRRRDLAV
jgi:ABC-2 type transport system permease protein